jgi:hypothetical protein
MLLAIPYQTVDISNVKIDPFVKDKRERTMASLQYEKGGLITQGLSILSPPLTVLSYDSSMNRLTLSMANQRLFTNRILALQDRFAETHPTIPLQRLCTPSILTLYVYPSYSIRPGALIRCIIRLQSLLFVETKTGINLRIQHSIPNIFCLE